ncbi:hypothetical protein EXT66_07375 [Pectobacterium carotovorum subsp. carotovorum]|uniref:hypothetical protein n=1 Tax=Pectobacterium versatile TaxID=2488639 RepID=UPI001939042F|nr:MULTISPECIES: hypothetical protein [Pectobacterium]MCA6925615.1 hypothetical protein [Pectobacterium versatile]MCH5082372.1 hypothetical protein [Pectobacterium versatile]MCL6333643.1 hypothetical protein [Pectobacterium carotovorum subsp. carotovorum]MCL6346663.1 hypothetical protein [Pectobacterium carotovorum subsp. carotovorum]MCL6401102.1 hypothetical protein [Pectobacterium carotovorum subsp. carotovorum]
MIDLKAIIEKESVSDIVSFFAGSTKGIGYPQLDNFFVRYRFDVISDGELLKVFDDLLKAGVVEWGEKMLVKKGPNWKEPKFVTEKKYGF